MVSLVVCLHKLFYFHFLFLLLLLLLLLLLQHNIPSAFAQLLK
jgi:hypothetical protein